MILARGLGAAEDLESHGTERVVEVVAHLRYRMKTACLRRLTRSRVVEGGIDSEGSRLLLFLLFLQHLLDRGSDFVSELTDYRSLFR